MGEGARGVEEGEGTTSGRDGGAAGLRDGGGGGQREYTTRCGGGSTQYPRANPGTDARVIPRAELSPRVTSSGSVRYVRPVIFTPGIIHIYYIFTAKRVSKTNVSTHTRATETLFSRSRISKRRLPTPFIFVFHPTSCLDGDGITFSQAKEGDCNGVVPPNVALSGTGTRAQP